MQTNPSQPVSQLFTQAPGEDPSALHDRRIGAIEAVLYVAGEAVPTESLAQLVGLSNLELTLLLDELSGQLDSRQSGMMLVRCNGQVQFKTRPVYAQAVRAVVDPPAHVSLSQAALETLSIVAYRQPITRAEIEGVRGVKCDYTLSVLAERGLICQVGRSQGLGRANLYGTTDRFLQHFGLESLNDLPGKYKLESDLAMLDEQQAARHAAYTQLSLTNPQDPEPQPADNPVAQDQALPQDPPAE